MKEEIKEILDRLKDSVNNPIVDVPVMGGVSEPIDNSQCLEPNECKILLDYITNLQEKNERLKNEKSILEKSLKLIWKKDIKIDYEELDKANKVVEKIGEDK